jgi:hypothetical protein
MQTRSSNAETHPGKKAEEALRVRRPKEVIQREKDEKKAKRDASEAKRIAKELHKEEGIEYVALLESKITAEVAKDKSQYPRHQADTAKFKRT